MDRHLVDARFARFLSVCVCVCVRVFVCVCLCILRHRLWLTASLPTFSPSIHLSRGGEREREGNTGHGSCWGFAGGVGEITAARWPHQTLPGSAHGRESVCVCVHVRACVCVYVFVHL